MVKLLVPEDGRDAVVALVAGAALVGTSRLSYVECHAALARTRREGRMTATDAATATRRLDDRWTGLVVVELDEPLGRAAARLCRDYPLRGADAVHIASAIQFVEAAEQVRFACWDRRLWDAAGGLGFARVPESLG